MVQDKDAVELAYAALAVFADDGKLDLGELNSLLGLALRDGKITDEERRVLISLFSRIREIDVEPAVWERIRAVKLQHGL
jgi:hypothetical protein